LPTPAHHLHHLREQQDLLSVLARREEALDAQHLVHAAQSVSARVQTQCMQRARALK
jgi:hypothetical protein